MSEDGLLLNLSTLKGIDIAAIDREVHQLLAIKAWALKSLRLDYEVGDRVEIVSWEPQAKAKERSSGWYTYREALACGQTGVVTEILFNRFVGSWQVLVLMDRCWS